MNYINDIVDKDSLIPVYHQIATALRERIKNNEWKIDSKIPSENELSEQFLVSRLTIRRALKELSYEGLIKSYRGMGSFVKHVPEPIIHDFSLPSMLYAKLGKIGIKLDAQILELKECENIVHINNVLKLNDSQRLVQIYRVFSLDNKPIAINQSWISSTIVPDMVEKGLIDDHLSITLSKRYNLMPVRIENTLSATKSTANEISLLEVSYDTPLIVVFSISYLETGVPLEYSRTVWVGDKVKFNFKMD